MNTPSTLLNLCSSSPEPPVPFKTGFDVGFEITGPTTDLREGEKKKRGSSDYCESLNKLPDANVLKKKLSDEQSVVSIDSAGDHLKEMFMHHNLNCQGLNITVSKFGTLIPLSEHQPFVSIL